MGDHPGNVEMRSHGKSVFLYTRCAGAQLPALVAEVLRHSHGGRLSYSCYLNHLIVRTVAATAGPADSPADVTKFGLDTEVRDGADSVIVVDHDRLEVYARGSELRYTFNEVAGWTSATWADLR